MHALLRSVNFFLLATYLSLSAIPLIPLFLTHNLAAFGRITGIAVAAWIAIWAVFKRPAWFHWLLLPAFIALPIELYLRAYYGQGISAHHLGIIVETSPKESLDFLGNKIWLLLVIILGIAIWFWLSWKAALATRDLDWTGPSRWLALSLLVVVLFAWLYDREVPIEAATAGASSHMTASSAGKASQTQNAWSRFPELPSWAKTPLDANTFGKTWPFGLLVPAYDFWKERAYLSSLEEKSRQFRFGAHQASKADPPQVVVMVIGESSRYDRWSLNGYNRETNPLLKGEPNFVSLTNIITAVSATRLSVPVLMSRKPAMRSLEAGFSEKSFLTAFKEAGFKTYWLSNQMSFGKFDTPVSVFANEADVTRFLNLGGINDNSNYDDVLLDPLRQAIADAAPKKLIVLHTLGNHWNYSHRYPKEFDKWRPSLLGVSSPAYTDLKLKPQLNNSYDNSILYTDWFLSQVIKTLKSAQQMTSMMYISDHGQALYDGSCTLAFHGHNTQYDFHVPAFVWYSNAYKSIYPEKVKQLLRHRQARLATENIFHSLLDMADIQYDSEQLERSFFHKNFRQQKRYVDSYGWTDYDNATFKGDCREVIGKNKPLPR